MGKACAFAVAQFVTGPKKMKAGDAVSRTVKWGTPAVWLAFAFLLVTYLLGGGARSDIMSLVLLRPIAAIVFAIGIVELNRGDLRRYRTLFGCLAAIALLAIFQLIPLPPAVWHQLPGHDVVRDIDAGVGLDDLWRPMSLAPNGTLNALFALLVPAAFLVHVVKLDASALRLLVIFAIVLGLLSAFIGIAQAVGSAGSGLYLYRITNHGFAVGLFSNRNHQAIVLACLFPMLAAYASFPVKQASYAKVRLILVLVIGGALIPLILITGSRLGAALGLFGILSAAWVYRAPETPEAQRRESKRRNFVPLIAGVVAIALVVVTAMLAQVSVFGRFAEGGDAVNDIRFQVWRPISAMIWEFFPLGSGLGSFAEVYKIYEPTELLTREYLNHAHNDLLEVALTAGLAGAAILVIATFSIGRSVLRTAFGSQDARLLPLRRMGAIVVVMIALASLVDYPLRTPSIACIFILATVCLRQERTSAQ